MERPEEAIKKLLDTRPRRFLELARSDSPTPAQSLSPSFKHACCEFSDLEREVGRHGFEETLLKLAAAGVYVTSDESRGTPK